MRRMLVWILLMCKRLLRRPSFVLILCLLPVVLLAYRFILQEDSQTVRVALYVNGEDAFCEEVCKGLLEEVSFVGYYMVDSEEEAYGDVAATRAECAYIFEPGLLQDIMKLEYEGKVTAISSDNTQYKSLINESVYCMIYHCFADDVTTELLLDYEKEKLREDPDYPALGEDGIRELISERYSARQSSIFTYYYLDRNDTEGLGFTTESSSVESNYLTKPIRGTIALFILLAGLAGLVFWFQDDGEGRFNAFPYYKRPLLFVGSMFLPAMLAGIMGYLCLFVSGVGQRPFKELGMMLAYVVLTTGFCNLLRLLVPSANAACAMIPILTLASYICAPVLMDMIAYIPAIRYVRSVLVVDYYLQAALSPAMILRFVLAAVILLPITVLLDYSGRFHRKLR